MKERNKVLSKLMLENDDARAIIFQSPFSSRALNLSAYLDRVYKSYMAHMSAKRVYQTKSYGKLISFLVDGKYVQNQKLVD